MSLSIVFIVKDKRYALLVNEYINALFLSMTSFTHGILKNLANGL